MKKKVVQFRKAFYQDMQSIPNLQILLDHEANSL